MLPFAPVYASLLSNRYLTSRTIPFIAVAAVALCVALVIIVVSVMSGFLEMVRVSGKSLTGDVVVSRPITGIPYYDELVRDIEALPEAEAAAPIIETFGLLRMPYGSGDGGKQVEMVEVWGIDPFSLDRVLAFKSKLYWRAPAAEELATIAEDDPRRDPFFQREADGMALRSREGADGIVLGIEISPFNRRQRDGTYRTIDPRTQAQSSGYFMANTEDVVLTLVPVSDSGSLSGEKKRRFSIVNEVQSGLYAVDESRVFVPLSTAQEMLLLDERPMMSRTEFDEDGRPKEIGTAPARATSILVRASAGTTPERLQQAVVGAYARFYQRIAADPARLVEPPFPDGIDISTWEERLANFIGPVEKERELMRTLFSIVYIVCAGLVLAIFWSIVQEKTRDIGILRAVGASRSGVLWIFLRYGLLIGIVGAIVGALLAWGVVRNINAIHDLLGTPAPAGLKVTAWIAVAASAGLALRGLMRASALRAVSWTFITIGLAAVATVLLYHRGFLVWDPSVYYFSRIPSSLDLNTVVTTMIGGVVFSIVGAAIPAARAADTDPVKSLRYE
ncbi:MAG: Lipoprotein-releasing system transrane protein LolE [Planctomycetota bacterium]